MKFQRKSEKYLDRNEREINDSSRFRLMYIVSDYGPLIDQISEALSIEGIDSEYVCYSISKNHCAEKIKGNAYYCSKIIPTARGFFWYLFRLRSIADKCIDYVKKQNPGILHGHMFFCDGIVCNRLKKKLGIDYVVSVRNTDMNLWFLWKLPWIKRRGIDVAINAKQIIFINNPYTNLFLERMPIKYRKMLREKMVIIPNGVDKYWHENKWRNRNLEDKNQVRLISVGRVEPNKNQLVVVEALKELRSRGIHVNYTNVGTFSDKEMAQKLSKTEDVRLVDNLPKERLIEEYRAADIFILPSLRETFGLVYVEAMTQGLPVLYSEGQGFDGQFENGEVGYRVNPKNPIDIADKVCRVIDNYTEISRRSLEESSVYTWSETARCYIKAYRKT